jgi:AraC-like DNA-binding protein/quercetin dioxygenase-like cupin family protein
MTTERDDSSTPIGAATELLAGRKGVALCYGTFAQDIPDQNFRLRISTVEHEGDFPNHGHEYSELGVVLGGSAVHMLPSHEHPLEAGDVFVIHGQSWHGFHAARQLKLCNIMFDPRQFFIGQRQLETMVGWQALFELGPSASTARQEHERLQLALPELSYTVGILTAMQEDYQNRLDGWQASLYGHFLVLVTALCRVYGRKTKEQTSPLLRFARVISHIQTNLHEPLRLPLLAKLAHLSVRQFQREFQRVYNTTPVSFIRQLRLREACERLKNPETDITSVAVDLGYSSVSFFSKQFKLATGLAPSDYRSRRLEELEKQSRHKLMIESLSKHHNGAVDQKPENRKNLYISESLGLLAER